MKGSFKIDTTNFERMVGQLSALSGKDFDEVLKSEISSVVATTINKTKFADEQKIRKLYSPENTKWSTGNPRGIKIDGKIVLMTWHFTDAKWAAIKERNASIVASLLQRIGLTKQSWLRLAEQMNLKLVQPKPTRVSKIESATCNGKKLDFPVSHLKESTPRGIGYEITNATKAAVRGDGARILLQAINGRTGYFYRNLKTGAFRSLEKIAKKYPGFSIG